MNNAWILVQKQACLGMLRKHVLSGYASTYVVINELKMSRATLKISQNFNNFSFAKHKH